MTPEFSWLRLLLTLIAGTAVIVIGSLFVRAHPNPGYQTGYDAAMSEGSIGIDCEELYRERDRVPLSPRYDRESFVNGCHDAVDHLSGRGQ